MNRLVGVVVGVAMVMAVSSAPRAQTKTFTGDVVTIKATVEAIDAVNRTLTVKNEKGEYVPILVPASMKRFPEIKVGDTIEARYYDNIVIRLKPEGEPAVDTSTGAITPGQGSKRVGTGAAQRTITAKIMAIDRSVPSITFKGEGVKWEYSTRVADKAALEKVNVGDRVDITWTEAVVVSIVSPAKK